MANNSVSSSNEDSQAVSREHSSVQNPLEDSLRVFELAGDHSNMLNSENKPTTKTGLDNESIPHSPDPFAAGTPEETQSNIDRKYKKVMKQEEHDSFNGNISQNCNSQNAASTPIAFETRLTIAEIERLTTKPLLLTLQPFLRLQTICAEVVSQVALILITFEFISIFSLSVALLYFGSSDKSDKAAAWGLSYSSLLYLLGMSARCFILFLVPILSSFQLLKVFRRFSKEAARLEKSISQQIYESSSHIDEWIFQSEEAGRIKSGEGHMGENAAETRKINRLRKEILKTERLMHRNQQLDAEMHLVTESSGTTISNIESSILPEDLSHKRMEAVSEQQLLARRNSLRNFLKETVNVTKMDDPVYWESDGKKIPGLSGKAPKEYPKIVPQTSSPLPSVSYWPYRPVYVRFVEEYWVLKELVRGNRRGSRGGKRNKPTKLNTVLPSYITKYPLGPLRLKDSSNNVSESVMNYFETPFFKGKILFRLASVEGHVDSAYFLGRKRFTQACIQGKFKSSFKFSEVLTGQIFEKQFSSLPPLWLLKLGFAIVRRLAPNIQDDISGESPFVLSPLITAAQVVHVSYDENDESERGDQAILLQPPDISMELCEETSLLGELFTNKKFLSSERRSFFSNLKNLNDYHFNPKYVYTFDFYQHIFNAGTYEFNFGFTSLDIVPYLNNQPVEIMAVIDNSLFTLEPNNSKSKLDVVSLPQAQRKKRRKDIGADAASEDFSRSDTFDSHPIMQSLGSPKYTTEGEATSKNVELLENLASNQATTHGSWGGWLNSISGFSKYLDKPHATTEIASHKAKKLPQRPQYLWRVQLCHEKLVSR